LPSEAGFFDKRWTHSLKVVEFVDTMRSDASLVMTMCLKRRRAADEGATERVT